MDQEELITNTTKRVAKNTGILIIGTIVSRLCFLAITVMAARFIGIEGFGKYSLALSFTALIVISGDIGLNMLAVREVASNKSLTNVYLGSIVILRTILSGFTVGIIFLIINLLNYPSETVRLIYIIGFSLFFLSLSQSFRWVFQAFQKMEYEALIIFLEGGLLLGISFLALYFKKGLIGLGWSYFLTYLVIFFLSFFITAKKFGRPKFKTDFVFWKYLIRSALPIGLGTIFFTIYTNLDTIFLSLMKGDQAVGLYNAGLKLVNSLRFLPTMFFLSIFPVMSEFHQSSKESLKMVLKKSVQYMFLWVLPLGVGTTILAPKIISLFFGQEFISAIFVLRILVWMLVLVSLSRVATYYLVAANKQVIFAFIFGTALIINVVLNLILIPGFSYLGAAITVVITEFFVFVLAFGFLLRNIKFNPFSRQIFKIAVASLIMGFLTWFIKDLNIILTVLISAIFYLIVLLLTKSVSREDKLLLKRAVSH